MSRACSSDFDCTPGWTGWPYTEQGRYSDDDESAGGSDDSDSAASDYDDGTRFYYRLQRSHVTIHRSCPAVACRVPIGILFVTRYTHNTAIATVERRLMSSVASHPDSRRMS